MRSQGSGDAGRLRQDERFAAMFKDPRFQRFPKKKHKVVIDKRFEGVLEDEDFRVTTAVDKRGRKVVKKKENDDLKRYYRLKDEDEWRDAKGGDDSAQIQKPTNGSPEPEGGAASQKQKKKDAALKEKADVVPVVKGSEKASRKAIEGKPKAPKQGVKLSKAASKQQSELPQAIKSKPDPKSKARSLRTTTQESLPADEDDEDADESEDEEEDEDVSEPEGLSAGKSDRQYMWERARGLAGPSSSDEEDGSEEDEDEDEEEEDGDEELDSADEPISDEERESEESMDLEEWGVGAYARDPDKDATLVDMEQDTSRLALVDLDWEHVKAVDLLAVLRSFCPRAGKVEKVTVYFSDYGLQRLAEETVAGPQGIYRSARKAQDMAAIAAGPDTDTRNDNRKDDDNEAEEDDSGSEEGDDGRDITDGEDEDDGEEEEGDESEDELDEEHAGRKLAALKKLQRERVSSAEEEDGEVDKVRLAMYERSKMRYYYAVAELDSPTTAAAVYAECDGLEFERSACKFDLRFVPDEQSFDGRKVRDSATTIPDDYKPPAIFNTSLQHTDPKLTWDADDDGRKRALTRKMTEEELKDADFAAYLGSDDSEGQEEAAAAEDPEAIRKRYQALLFGGDGGKSKQKGKSWGDDEEGSSEGGDDEDNDDDGEKPGTSRIKNDDGMEMEITFQPGLESLGQRLLDKKQEEAQRKGETVWEAYLRRKREKRLKKKMDKKGRRADSSDDDDSDGGSADGDNLYDNGDNVGGKDDPFFQHEDDPFADPFFQDGDAKAPLNDERNSDEDNKGSTKKKGKDKKGSKSKQDNQESRETKQQQKELELLMMDDAALHEVARGKLGLLGAAAAKGAAEEEPSAGRGKGKLSKKEKRKQKVQAKKKAREGSDEEDLQDDGFEVNLSDPRFSEVLSSHHFAVDPTDPRFKKSRAAQSIMEAARKVASTHSAPKPAPKVTSNENNGEQSRAGIELKAMVAKLKRKSAQLTKGKDAGDANGRPVKQKRHH